MIPNVADFNIDTDGYGEWWLNCPICGGYGDIEGYFLNVGNRIALTQNAPTIRDVIASATEHNRTTHTEWADK